MYERGYLSTHLLMLIGIVGIIAVWFAFDNVIKSGVNVSASPVPSVEVSPTASASATLAPKKVIASVKPSPTPTPKPSAASSAPTLTPAQSSSGNSNSSTSTSTPTPTPTQVSQQDIKPFCSGVFGIPGNSGTAPFSVLLSTGGGSGTHGSIAGYQWDLNGDGGWDTDIVGSDRNHVFSSAGSYTVIVRLKTSTGDYSDPCSGTFTVS